MSLTESPVQPPCVMPDYQVGDKVCYKDQPDNVWTVLEIRPFTNHVWVLAKQNGMQQSFPSVVFIKAGANAKEKYIPTKDAFEKPRKKADPNDPITKLMRGCADIEACWVLAGRAGMDVAEAKSKIAHLSVPLQRMGITNRLRKMLKDGLFNPEDLL